MVFITLFWGKFYARHHNGWKNNVLTFGGNVQKLFAIEKKYSDIGQYPKWALADLASFDRWLAGAKS